MAIIRHEIYDENGLVRVEEVEVEDIDISQQIADKEAELLRVYQEIQNLKKQSEQN